MYCMYLESQINVKHTRYKVGSAHARGHRGCRQVEAVKAKVTARGCIKMKRVSNLSEEQKKTLDSMNQEQILPSGTTMCTGWFKLIAPNSFRVQQCPRHFWEIDPEVLHASFKVPLPNRQQKCVCFFPPGIWVFVFSGCLGLLRDPTFPAKKKKIVKGLAGAD